MDHDDGASKRDLRALLGGYPASPPTDQQKSSDAQLTRYEPGSGDGLAEIRDQLARDPGNERLLDWLAFALYSNNDLDQAIQAYQQLIERAPANTTYHYYLGNCFAKLGAVPRAIEAWKRVLRIDPYCRMGRKAAARVEQAGRLLRLVTPHPDDHAA